MKRQSQTDQVRMAVVRGESRRLREGAASAESMALDPFSLKYEALGIATPPYPLDLLASMGELSDAIWKCAAAMAANVGGQGYDFVPAEDVRCPAEPSEADEARLAAALSTLSPDAVAAITELAANGRSEALDRLTASLGSDMADLVVASVKWAEVQAERARVRRFFRYFWVRGSWAALEQRQVVDKQLTGNCYMELIRGADDIKGGEHLPTHTMRIARPLGSTEMAFWERSETGEWVMRKRMYRPWRYVQWVNGELRWFKEYGDLRPMHCETGDYETPSKPVPLDKRATEVWHRAEYVSGRTPYGIPFYISAFNQAVGRAEAAEKNLDAIADNGIPSGLLLASGIENLDAFVQHAEEKFRELAEGEGRAGLMVIAAKLASNVQQAMEGGSGGQAVPKLDVVKLNDLILKDALFKDYMKSTELDVLGTRRLPGIVVGASHDYTRATADAAMRAAQQQVFGPEASTTEWWINNRLLPDLGVRYWDFRVRMTTISDESIVGAVVQALTEAGGITPRMARDLAERFLGAKGGPGQPWDDVPSSLLKGWAQQLPPPAELLEALGVVEAVAGDEGVGDTEEPASPQAKRARQIRAAMVATHGRQRAAEAAAVARLVISGLLEARRQIEDAA